MVMVMIMMMIMVMPIVMTTIDKDESEDDEDLHVYFRLGKDPIRRIVVGPFRLVMQNSTLKKRYIDRKIDE